jgi:membrane protein DedA with SNARE-associated domain
MAEYTVIKHRPISRRVEYSLGVLALLLIAGIAALVASNWHDLAEVASYGFFGAFVLSVLGGATVPVPLPVTAAYFTLGGLLQLGFGPEALAPAALGLAAGLGEALGGLTTYATGYSGGASLAHKPVSEKPGRMERAYRLVMRFMERRGLWTLFAVSALINPFYYPVALAAGLSRLSPVRFFVVCLAGKTIKCSLVAYAGFLGLRGLFEALGIDV